MRTTFELRTPDEVECSLTITGRIKDMKTLRTQLVDAGKATHWPLLDIINQIDESRSGRLNRKSLSTRNLNPRKTHE